MSEGDSYTKPFQWEDGYSLSFLQTMCDGFVDVKIGSVRSKGKSAKVIECGSEICLSVFTSVTFQ